MRRLSRGGRRSAGGNYGGGACAVRQPGLHGQPGARQELPRKWAYSAYGRTGDYRYPKGSIRLWPERRRNCGKRRWSCWHEAELIIGIDQSTQGTKAMLLDGNGISPLCQVRTKTTPSWSMNGPWASQSGRNLSVINFGGKRTDEKAVWTPSAVACVGISNQRETAMAWNRSTGKPVYNAIVWQCARGEGDL